jgi:L-lactate dehydrogenase complex protein LldE
MPNTSPGQSTPPPSQRRVALFVTCMVDTLYPDVGLATVDLLQRHGVEVLFPEAQTCCGQPAFNSGYRHDARQVARHFLDVFWPLIDTGEVDAIVAPSGSCVAMVRHHYETLFAEAGDTEELDKTRRLSRQTYELTQYLVDVVGIRDPEARFPAKVTYHPCCHLLREMGIDAQPRTLLAHVREAEVVELPGADECCGFGGTFAVKNAAISTAMGQRKTRNVAASGAEIVAVNDVSCMTHLNGLFQREGGRCRAMHIAEVLRRHEG